MANKTYDSSGVGACLNHESGGSQNVHVPVGNLIDLPDNVTSFGDPIPSTVSSTAGTSGSGSGSRRGSGTGSGAGADKGTSEGRAGSERQQGSGAPSGTSRDTPSGSDDGGRSDEETSKSSEDKMQYKHSGASSLTTREAPKWNARTARDCNVKLTSLHYTADHTVLINVNEFNRNRQLIAVHGKPQWDADHVKMPHANESIFMKAPFLSLMGNTEAKSRWGTISKHLKKLKTHSPTVADIEEAIKAYNPQYKDSWFFVGLQQYVENIPGEEKEIFFKVIPRMAELALKLEDNVQRGLPLLKQARSQAITLSQIQIATLLANAFFCTFPHRNTSAKNAEYSNYPTINFSSLFGNSSRSTNEKLRAIVHYFNVVTSESKGLGHRGWSPLRDVSSQKNNFPVGDMHHSFASLNFALHCLRRAEHLGNVRVTSEGTIEKEGKGMLQVDFACNMVGGGVLGSGLVQEEILFLMNPELIVSRLFTERLSDNECLKITGAQQYSEYTGYSSSFQWGGPHVDDLSRDNWMRLHRQIVAIDALNFKHPKEQYQMQKIKRELNKAFVGFSEEGRQPHELPTVATGNWGCGAFHGDPILKALIQMMAAAVAKRDMVFFTFENKRLEERVQKMHTLFKERKSTVGDLYTMLEFYCQGRPPGDLYQFIKNYMKSSL